MDEEYDNRPNRHNRYKTSRGFRSVQDTEKRKNAPVIALVSRVSVRTRRIFLLIEGGALRDWLFACNNYGYTSENSESSGNGGPYDVSHSTGDDDIHHCTSEKPKL